MCGRALPHEPPESADQAQGHARRDRAGSRAAALQPQRRHACVEPSLGLLLSSMMVVRTGSTASTTPCKRTSQSERHGSIGSQPRAMVQRGCKPLPASWATVVMLVRASCDHS